MTQGADLIQPIRLLILDVDGVLTDGGIIYDDAGREFKRFCVRDGTAIKLWQALTRPVAVISARESSIVQRRMTEVGVSLICQGIADKGEAAESIMKRTNMTAEQTCYVGDDLADLPAMRRVALPVAVADAAEEVRRAARWISLRRGGHGAVREIVEWILRRQKAWSEALGRLSGTAEPVR